MCIKGAFEEHAIRTAKPRLIAPQQVFNFGSFLRYVHRISPVFASSATTLFGGSVKYMTPLTTSGVI